MTVASIDIGTNTVLLLIAEINPGNQSIVPIKNVYRMPRIGRALKAGEKISETSIEKLIKVLEEYNSIISNRNIDKTIVTATNAFRLASNSKEIVTLVKQKYNLDVEIISGDREAEYAYLGAVSGSVPTGSVLVIDIGGGSTELILGRNDKIEFRKSHQIGSVSATEDFFVHLPPTENEIQLLIKSIHSVLLPVSNSRKPEIAVAVAGTPTTLACMHKNIKEFIESEIEGSHLKFADLNKLIGVIKKLTPEEIKERYGEAMNGREDIILAGAIILSELMQLLKLENVIVSSRGIRYGAIKYYIKKNLMD